MGLEWPCILLWIVRYTLTIIYLSNIHSRKLAAIAKQQFLLFKLSKSAFEWLRNVKNINIIAGRDITGELTEKTNFALYKIAINLILVFMRHLVDTYVDS